MSRSELLGWYGVGAILFAYGAVSFGVLSNTSWLYQALNLTGAIGVAYDAWKQRNWQPVVLNLIWALIALISVVKSIV